MMKQTMTPIRKSAQAGFTLIELIVVIVILGILAATALPKFANLGGDARAATLKAAQGALGSTVAMIHGQYLISAAATYTAEGVAVTVLNGYPDGGANTASAAGITSADYTIVTNTTGTALTATATQPAVPALGFIVVPKGIAATATTLTCFLSYTPAANTTTPPVVSVTSTTC